MPSVSLESSLLTVTVLSPAARVTSRFSWLITSGSVERNSRHCSLSVQPSIATGTMPRLVWSAMSYTQTSWPSASRYASRKGCRSVRMFFASVLALRMPSK